MPPEADAEGLARGVAGIWWDSGQIEIPTRPLFDRLLKLQPKPISNGRIQSGRHHVPGVTFGTPEQELGAFKLSEPWESCVTMMGENWFWNGGQDIRSAESCIRLLVNCAIGDGNLLLDFGPDVLGRIHPKVKENFKQIGQWLGQFSQSVRGTRGGPFMPDQWGGSTRPGNTIYLHILQTWTGRQLRLPLLPRKIVAAKVLTGGRAVVAQTEDGITLEIDPAQHPRLDTIVALEVDGSAMELKPIPARHGHWESLTVDATVRASSSVSFWAGMAPDCVVLHSWERGAPPALARRPGALPKEMQDLVDRPRGHLWRTWTAKDEDAQPWLEVDLGQPKTFDTVYLREKFNRIRAFKIQIASAKGWRTIFEGRELDLFTFALPEPVTVQPVRLLITQSTLDGPDKLGGPALQEFDLFSSSR